MAEYSETFDPKEAEKVKQRLMVNPKFNDLLRIFDSETKKEKPKYNFEQNRQHRLKSVDNEIYSHRGKNMKEKITFLKNDILYNSSNKPINKTDTISHKVVYEKPVSKNNYFEFKK
jgi:hypothetical protein